MKAFLESLPDGSIVLDTGCGNGKYSRCNPNVVWIGSDYSAPLLHCALARNLAPDSSELNVATDVNPSTSSFTQSDERDEGEDGNDCVDILNRPEVFVSDCLRMNVRPGKPFFMISFCCV